VNEATKLAKSSYYNTYFAANEAGNVWKGINLIMAKTRETTKINALKIGNVSYTFPREISDSLCWSRGAASVLYVSCCLVLLPMCRNVLALIRNSNKVSQTTPIYLHENMMD